MNKYWLVIGVIIFMSANVFSAPSCISEIPDIYYGQEPLPSGALISTGRFASFVIEPAATSSGVAVIEISSGGRYGADRDRYLNIAKTHVISVWLDRETLPLYITCHNAEWDVGAKDASIGWVKKELVQEFIFAKAKTYEDVTPEDEMVLGVDALVSSVSNISDSLDDVADNVLIAPTRFEDINLTSEYKVIDRSDTIVLFFGGILLVIGVFGALAITQKFFK